MEIQNRFCEDSLDHWQKDDIASRMGELTALYDVSEKCKEKNEKWSIPVKHCMDRR